MLDGIEEHVTSNISNRETKTSKALNEDYVRVSEGIQ